MKRLTILLVAGGMLLSLAACLKKPDEDNDSVTIGSLSVDLNATESHVRTQESLIGNFMADAILNGLNEKGCQLDLAVMNAGGIRFDAEIRPNGIYPKGVFTNEMLEEMLPFTENKLVVVEVTGNQIREILERSVAQLPLDKGAFLQISKDWRVSVDASKQAQVIDETVSPPQLISAGERILSIYYKEAEINPQFTYRLGILDYLTEGNDGYVTFQNIPETKITRTEIYLNNLIRDQIIVYSPINPSLEGRIFF